MRVEFRKYHALGNDYIVIDPNEFAFAPEAAAVRAVCDRNRGAGSDGILLGPLAERSGTKALSAGAMAAGQAPWLRIFNPDGSEAEKSGNGLRIFCLFLAERGYVGSREFRLNTAGGLVEAQVESLAPPLVRVDMGEPSFSAQAAGLRTDLGEFIQGELDLSGSKLKASFVSMGNPHCVIFADDPRPELAKSFGPLIEGHPLFPERTNVQFVKVLDRHSLRIEIWERGAGYTLASGSSSCAAASVAKKLGLVDDQVTVFMPGGELSLDLSAPSIRMRGPASCVYEGCFSGAMRRELAALGALGALGANSPLKGVK